MSRVWSPKENSAPLALAVDQMMTTNDRSIGNVEAGSGWSTGDVAPSRHLFLHLHLHPVGERNDAVDGIGGDEDEDAEKDEEEKAPTSPLSMTPDTPAGSPGRLAKRH